MTTAEVRAALNETGVLFTKDNNDPGHISGFWRSRVLGLCATIDALPTNVGELLRLECWNHGQTHHRLAARDAEVLELRRRLDSKDEEIARALEREQGAERLVEEALPRMQTLHSAMTPDWLRRAHAFLGA